MIFCSLSEWDHCTECQVIVLFSPVHQGEHKKPGAALLDTPGWFGKTLGDTIIGLQCRAEDAMRLPVEGRLARHQPDDLAPIAPTTERPQNRRPPLRYSDRHGCLLSAFAGNTRLACRYKT